MKVAHLKTIPGLADTIYHASHDHMHFGIHSLLDLESQGPRYWALSSVYGKLKRSRKKAYVDGTVCHVMTLEGEEQARKKVAIEPETYPSWDKWTKIKAKQQDITADNLPDGWKIDEKGFVHEPVNKPWFYGAAYCDDWRREHEREGRVVCPLADWNRGFAMRNAIMQHEEGAKLYRIGQPEITLRMVYTGLNGSIGLQCRPDWLAGGRDPDSWEAINDLKTIDNINNVDKQIGSFNYWRQAAFYQFIAYQFCGRWLPFRLGFVEKAPQHRVCVKEIPDDAFGIATQRNLDVIEQACTLLGKHIPAETPPEQWPDGSPAGIQKWTMPRYLKTEEELAE